MLFLRTCSAGSNILGAGTRSNVACFIVSCLLCPLPSWVGSQTANQSTTGGHLHLCWSAINDYLQVLFVRQADHLKATRLGWDSMSPTINDLYADVAGSGYVTTSVPGDADVLGIVPETGQPFSGGGSKYGIQSTDGQAIFHVLVIGFCNQLLWYWRMLTCFLFTSMLQQYSGFAFGQVIVWCGQPSLAWQTCHPIIGLNTVKA